MKIPGEPSDHPYTRGDKVAILLLMALVTALIIITIVKVGEPFKMANTPTIAQCDTEDSGQVYPCLWDAHTQGNGRGQSYILEPDGSTFYLAGNK